MVLEYLEKSLNFSIELFGKNSLEVARIYDSIGLVRLENLDFDESEIALTASLHIKQE